MRNMFGQIFRAHNSRKIAGCLLTFLLALAGDSVCAEEPEEPPAKLREGWKWVVRVPGVDKEEIAVATDGRGRSQELRHQRVTPGAWVKLWVQQGWLLARRTTDDEIEWQVVLARASDPDRPVIQFNAAEEAVHIRYRGFFIRDNRWGHLRILREPKTDESPDWPLLDFDPWEHEVINMRGGSLQLWESDYWTWLRYGPAPARPDVWLRLCTTSTVKSKLTGGMGVRSMTGQVHEAWDDHYRAQFERDLCIAKRMTAESADATWSGLRERLGTAEAPEITGQSWRNVKAPLTADDLKGKVVVLNFWAAWCPRSVARLARLEQLHQIYGPRGVVVIGLHAAHETERMAEVLQGNGVTFPAAIDTGERVLGKRVPGETAERFHADVLPTSFLINRDGKVVRGYRMWPPRDEEIEALLEPAK